MERKPALLKYLFLGQYQHTLDNKGRVSIPKNFRKQLKEVAILTRGLDNCLFLYPIEEWKRLSEQIQDLPLTAQDARSFSRYLFSGAIEVSCDNLGRIVIPDYLLTHAYLEKKLVIIGVLNRAEIWSDKMWLRFNKKINRSGEEIAEKLSGSGI